ncbi:AraC family transcriptional regulator [Streptococcus massiliensis]|uniref:AraC family transcriptional regulator n=1 Tax=Streptococcus massiliensis TaxID=313439 RepID=A0A380L151_9STRE|nr:AraC family transcriptional regulator [Streptococcus massiliensis]
MNMIESFNQTIDYLESQLTGDIDEKKVAQLSGYSYAMFSRIFSIFTGITLSEYLRYRRMTEAGLELRSSRIKVLDLALKYGYDSPDSFTAAFKSFHVFTPSEVRKGQPFVPFLN